MIEMTFRASKGHKFRKTLKLVTLRNYISFKKIKTDKTVLNNSINIIIL